MRTSAHGRVWVAAMGWVEPTADKGPRVAETTGGQADHDRSVINMRKNTATRPRGPKPTPAHSRVLAMVQCDGDCWVPTRYIGSNGYGYVVTGSNYDGSRKAQPAHRVVYEALVGPIVAGMQLHHECGVRACVNPDHVLELYPSEHTRLHHTAAGPCPKCGTDDWYTVPKTGRKQCRECRRRRRRERGDNPLKGTRRSPGSTGRPDSARTSPSPMTRTPAPRACGTTVPAHAIGVSE